MKLHIKRQRNHWILEQNGVLVDWSLSFSEICAIAAEWQRNGWIVARGWHGR